MVSGNLLSAMILTKLTKKIFNGSTHVVVDYVIGSDVDNMRSLITLRGDDYTSLHKYLKASTQMCDFFK